MYSEGYGNVQWDRSENVVMDSFLDILFQPVSPRLNSNAIDFPTFSEQSYVYCVILLAVVINLQTQHKGPQGRCKIKFVKTFINLFREKKLKMNKFLCNTKMY